MRTCFFQRDWPTENARDLYWWALVVVGGVVTEDQPFKVFEFSSNGGDCVIGSEFLDSGGMQAKA